MRQHNRRKQQQQQQRPHTQAIITRWALQWTAVTLAGMALLALFFSKTTEPDNTVLRSLLLQEDNNNNNYTSYSCHDLYTITPNAGDDQCHFARHCNSGTGVWAPSVFCSLPGSSVATNRLHCTRYSNIHDLSH